VGVALAADVPHVRPVVGGPDRPFLPFEPVGWIEPRPGVEDDDLVVGRQPIGDQRARRPRADDTDVGIRDGRPIRPPPAVHCGPRW
jgi:hypothetical protein